MNQLKLLSAGLLLATSGSVTSPRLSIESSVELRKGPYKVVVSKPIATPGHKVGTLYTEHEYLTEMMNHLDEQGLRPVFSELLGPAANQVGGDVRMLLLCVEK